jgi:hypothetical protein
MDQELTNRTASVDELSSHRDAIVRRLDDGYTRIDRAIANGEDVRTWEEFWVTLLAEYEALSDELSAAA